LLVGEQRAKFEAKGEKLDVGGEIFMLIERNYVSRKVRSRLQEIAVTNKEGAVNIQRNYSYHEERCSPSSMKLHSRWEITVDNQVED
jgi:hypothetical protein